MPATLESNGQATAELTLADTMAAAQSRFIDAQQTPEPVEETVEQTDGEATETQTEETVAGTSGVVETPTTGAPAKAAEGLDPQLLQAAIDADIPVDAAMLMGSNENLAKFIQMYGVRREAKQEDADSEGRRLAKEVADSLVIPEGELDLNDPKDRLIHTLVESQKKLADMLGGTFDATKKVGQLREKDNAQREHDAEVSEFDSTIDSLGHGDFFKESASPERIEVWNTYKGLRATNPAAKKSVLMERAARATYPELVTKAAENKQQAALSAQNGTKLGGGKTAPAAVAPPTPRDAFLARLNEANKKAIAKRGY